MASEINNIINISERIEYSPSISGIILSVFSLGLACIAYFSYQYCQLKSALQTGHIEEAQESIKKGGWVLYKRLVTKEDIEDLARNDKIESIRLIVNQIIFNQEDPTGGSRAAEAVIAARDDGENLKILTILSYAKAPRTLLGNNWNYSCLDGNDIFEKKRKFDVFCPASATRFKKQKPYIPSSRARF